MHTPNRPFSLPRMDTTKAGPSMPVPSRPSTTNFPTRQNSRPGTRGQLSVTSDGEQSIDTLSVSSRRPAPHELKKTRVDPVLIQLRQCVVELVANTIRYGSVPSILLETYGSVIAHEQIIPAGPLVSQTSPDHHQKSDLNVFQQWAGDTPMNLELKAARAELATVQRELELLQQQYEALRIELRGHQLDLKSSERALLSAEDAEVKARSRTAILEKMVSKLNSDLATQRIAEQKLRNQMAQASKLDDARFLERTQELRDELSRHKDAYRSAVEQHKAQEKENDALKKELEEYDDILNEKQQTISDLQESIAKHEARELALNRELNSKEAHIEEMTSKIELLKLDSGHSDIRSKLIEENAAWATFGALMSENAELAHTMPPSMKVTMSMNSMKDNIPSCFARILPNAAIKVKPLGRGALSVVLFTALFSCRADVKLLTEGNYMGVMPFVSPLLSQASGTLSSPFADDMLRCFSRPYRGDPKKGAQFAITVRHSMDYYKGIAAETRLVEYMLRFPHQGEATTSSGFNLSLPYPCCSLPVSLFQYEISPSLDALLDSLVLIDADLRGEPCGSISCSTFYNALKTFFSQPAHTAHATEIDRLKFLAALDQPYAPLLRYKALFEATDDGSPTMFFNGVLDLLTRIHLRYYQAVMQAVEEGFDNIELGSSVRSPKEGELPTFSPKKAFHRSATNNNLENELVAAITKSWQVFDAGRDDYDPLLRRMVKTVADADMNGDVSKTACQVYLSQCLLTQQGEVPPGALLPMEFPPPRPSAPPKETNEPPLGRIAPLLVASWQHRTIPSLPHAYAPPSSVLPDWATEPPLRRLRM